MSIKPVPSGPTPRPGARTPVGKGPDVTPRPDEKVQGLQRGETPATDDVQVSAAARELQASTGAVPSGELSPERLGQVVDRLVKGHYEEEGVRDETVDRVSEDL